MIRRILPASLLTIAILTSTPLRAAEPPFEPSLLRLSEVLGSLHYLSALCGQEEPQWRELMEKLIAAEAPDEARKARFTASFNRGYRSFASVYTTCTASARTAMQRYQTEGKELAGQTAARFGN